MTSFLSLFSAISGQFSKALVLSALLPVTLFVLLSLALVLPLVPPTLPVQEWIESWDSEWKAAAVVLTIVLLTNLLHALNDPITRFYQGFPWSDSWLGRWRIAVHRRRFVDLHSRWHGLTILLRLPEAKQHPDYEKVTDYWNYMGRQLNLHYPETFGQVLPTKVGNVIRSFEAYPYRQYRIRAITVWPRLVGKIEPGYAAQIDEAKSSFDFMLNSSLLCGIFALVLAVVRIAFPAGLAMREALAFFLTKVALFLLLAWVFYLAAIPRAHAWGMLVKGSFDLFRRDLLTALGFKLPRSLMEERGLWQRISEQLIFSHLTVASLPEFDAAPVAPTQAMSETGGLEVTKGVEPPERNGVLTVRIRVRNPNPDAVAPRVSVTDTLPDGWSYEWNSASASSGSVEVSGFNPYCFRLGDLRAGAEVLLTYRVVPIPQKK